jgi:hypothetical protein
MDIRELPTIEIHSAFCWDCDHCGTENFVRAITVCPDEPEYEEAVQALREIGDLQEDSGPNVGLSITKAPETVTCVHCGTEYAIVEPGSQAGL